MRADRGTRAPAVRVFGGRERRTADRGERRRRGPQVPAGGPTGRGASQAGHGPGVRAARALADGQGGRGRAARARDAAPAAVRGVRGVRGSRGAAEQLVHCGRRGGAPGARVLRAVRPAGRRDDGVRRRGGDGSEAGPRRGHVVLARGAGWTRGCGTAGPGRRASRRQLPQGGQPAAAGHDVDGKTAARE